jgi:hypothetical protein
MTKMFQLTNYEPALTEVTVTVNSLQAQLEQARQQLELLQAKNQKQQEVQATAYSVIEMFEQVRRDLREHINLNAVIELDNEILNIINTDNSYKSVIPNSNQELEDVEEEILKEYLPPISPDEVEGAETTETEEEYKVDYLEPAEETEEEYKVDYLEPAEETEEEEEEIFLEYQQRIFQNVVSESVETETETETEPVLFGDALDTIEDHLNAVDEKTDTIEDILNAVDEKTIEDQIDKKLASLSWKELKKLAKDHITVSSRANRENLQSQLKNQLLFQLAKGLDISHIIA